MVSRHNRGSNGRLAATGAETEHCGQPHVFASLDVNTGGTLKKLELEEEGYTESNYSSWHANDLQKCLRQNQRQRHASQLNAIFNKSCDAGDRWSSCPDVTPPSLGRQSNAGGSKVRFFIGATTASGRSLDDEEELYKNYLYYIVSTTRSESSELCFLETFQQAQENLNEEIRKLELSRQSDGDSSEATSSRQSGLMFNAGNAIGSYEGFNDSSIDSESGYLNTRFYHDDVENLNPVEAHPMGLRRATRNVEDLSKLGQRRGSALSSLENVCASKDSIIDGSRPRLHYYPYQDSVQSVALTSTMRGKFLPPLDSREELYHSMPINSDTPLSPAAMLSDNLHCSLPVPEHVTVTQPSCGYTNSVDTIGSVVTPQKLLNQSQKYYDNPCFVSSVLDVRNDRDTAAVSASRIEGIPPRLSIREEVVRFLRIAMCCSFSKRKESSLGDDSALGNSVFYANNQAR